MAVSHENEVLDGETSELWRALQVETLCFDGVWVRRTDHFPFGVTCKPGVDPSEVRAQVAEDLSLPGVVIKPSEVRLLDPWA
jgi:hypothetical protein